jgi:hypothetical protein
VVERGARRRWERFQFLGVSSGRGRVGVFRVDDAREGIGNLGSGEFVWTTSCTLQRNFFLLRVDLWGVRSGSFEFGHVSRI